MKKSTIFVLLGTVVVAVAAGTAYILTRPSANDTFMSVAGAIASGEAEERNETVEPAREVIAGAWSKAEYGRSGMLVGFETPAVALDDRSALWKDHSTPTLNFECYPEDGFAPWVGLIAAVNVWMQSSVPLNAKELPVFLQVDQENVVLKNFEVGDSRSLLALRGQDGRALLEQLSSASEITILIPGQTLQFKLDGLKTISSELLANCPAKNSSKPSHVEVIIESDSDDPPPPPVPN